MKFLKSIFIFFATFIFYHLLFSQFFPVDENNVLQAPDWYSTLGFTVSIVSAVYFTRKKKLSKKKILRYIKQERVPFSSKMQTEMAKEILEDIALNAELMNKATKIPLFVLWYDESLKYLEFLSKLKKVDFHTHPQRDLSRLKSEFQWHLCDAIARAKEYTISEIKGKYKNSKEFQNKAAKSFEDDIRKIQHRFSDDTSEFAAAAVKEVNGLVSARTVPHTQDDFTKYGGIDAELLTIDLMEGHEFEYWCASLLKKIGFQKADVTQASGDDGVDIIAEKDGIRYAVQCKCYSSDPGNKPVQEVHTGKAVYQCHVGAVMTNRHFTAGGKRAADATGTLLWDRDWITKALEQIKE